MFSHDVAHLLNILTFSCSTADISFACYHIFRIFCLFPFCIKSLFIKKEMKMKKKTKFKRECCSIRIWVASWQNQQKAGAPIEDSDQSDRSLHCVLNGKLRTQAFFMRTAKTGQMSRLIWVFAGCTCHFVGFVVRRLIFSMLQNSM